MIRSLRAMILPLVLAAATPAFCAPTATPPSPVPGTRTLYLVRHGLYDEDDPRDEAVGRGLVPVGREQARRVGARLAALGAPFDTLFTSPFTRARETAAIVAESLPGLTPVVAAELAECAPPTSPQDASKTPAAAQAEACRAQLERAFARFFTPSPAGDRHEILICHGNVIRWLWCRALGVDPTAWLRMTIANCSLTVIQVRPDGTCKLFLFGDIGHLPPELIAYPGGAAPPWRTTAPR